MLLAWAFLGDDLLGWALARDGIAKWFQERFPVRELNMQLRRFRDACARATGDPAELGEVIARRLLMPLADVLGKAARVLVVPYGAAHGIPFAALPFEGAPGWPGRVVSTAQRERAAVPG